VTVEEFTEEFAEMLGVDANSMNVQTDLTALPEWDSVAYLSAMVLIDERLGVSIRPDAISDAKTFGDILRVVEPALEA